MTPKREAELFDRERFYAQFRNQAVARERTSILKQYPTMKEEDLGRELIDPDIFIEDILGFIQSECRRNRVEAVKEFAEKVRPELVYQIDNDFAGLQSRNFQDGVYWGRKMVQEKITQALAELEGKEKIDGNDNDNNGG